MNTTKNNEKNIGPDMLTKAMIKFQESMGLNQTGESIKLNCYRLGVSLIDD